jgi:hypothetical protein
LQSLTGPNRSTQSLNQIIQSPPKPLTLLVAEIADVKQSVLELPSELRAAALLQPLHQVSKPSLERYNKPGAQAIGQGRKAVNLARLRRERILLQSNRVSLRDPLNDPPFSSAFCEIAMGCGDFGSGDTIRLNSPGQRRRRTSRLAVTFRNYAPRGPLQDSDKASRWA